MKKIRENKVLLVLAIILLICFALIAFVLFKYFYVGYNLDKYGDRLDGIESHEIHSTLKSEIEELYKDTKMSLKSLKISGKIIYVTFDLSEVIKTDDAKNLVLKSLEKFSDDEKNYYDIQFIVKCDSEESSETSFYPIMGYKNSSSFEAVWTRN